MLLLMVIILLTDNLQWNVSLSSALRMVKA
jgi:hypothetical protein